MSGDLHQRVFALDDIQIRAGGDGRTVTAYAAVFDSPAEIHDQDGHYLEQISRTAFDKTLQERAGRIGVFYNHARTLHGTPSEQGSVPIGTPIEPPRPDGRGLLTVTRYNKTPLADAVLEAIRNGDITGQSFTGRFYKSDPAGPYLPQRSGDLTLVTRKEIGLIEYGPTPIPAYADAEIVGVRAAEAEPEREFITVRSIREAAEPSVTTETAPEGAPEAADAAESSTSDREDGTPAAASTGAAEPEPQPEVAAQPEPQITHSATTITRSTTSGADMDDRMTVEERTARQSEIRARLAEIDTEFSGAVLPDETQTEWNDLQAEYVNHDRAIEAATARAEQLRALAAEPGATERVDSQRAGFGGRQAPAVLRRPDNIYDLAEVRNQARSVDELPSLYRERAMRAIEQSQFPGARSREDAQERAAHLVETIDDEQGTLARRMLATGSPLYNRAFGKMMQKLSTNGLTAEESRALALGVDTAGGYAVPMQLDPTIILTSDGAINPLRQVARQVQIVGKVWEGVTSAGVTVTRGAEGDEAPDSTPTLAQPSVTTTRVQGFVPFSVEIERSWSEMRGEVTMLLQDAKDMEEANSFILGDGTGTNPSGLIGTMPAGQKVGQTGSAGSLTVPDDMMALEMALPPRFRPRASWLANKAIYNKVRSVSQSKGGLAGDVWARMSGGQPPEMLGYPAYEVSSMDGTIESSGAGANLVLAFGDFRTGFLIVDRIGMSVELVPHLFGANGRPTGQRGIYAYWSNNCKIIVPNAIRVLNVVSPT
ncbi:phage major capsid protein [Streptomyces sp. CPS1]